MSNQLEGHRIAVLATDGVEQVELTEPRKALEESGAETHLVSPKPAEIQAVKHLDKGDAFSIDRTLDRVSASDYDGLFLPGGVANPDALRLDPKAVQFVRDFFAQKKPVAAICHGPWMLVEADVVRHRTLTSWPSLRTDISNAGGRWVDEEVHVDQGLVTSRKPDDLAAFCSALVEQFSQAHFTHGAQVHSGGGGAEDKQSALDRSAEDSFPASDAPSSMRST
jgi:protease I